MAGASTTCGTSSLLSSESDDEGEDEEDNDGDGDDPLAKDAAACGFNAGVFFETSASSEEESEESGDEEEDDAWRRLRFLLRLRGAVGLAVGIWLCNVAGPMLLVRLGANTSVSVARTMLQWRPTSGRAHTSKFCAHFSILCLTSVANDGS